MGIHNLKEVTPVNIGGEVTMLPSFSIDEKQLPEIKQWKVGNKYKFEVEAEMVSASKNEYGNSLLNARFKIHKIGTDELMEESEKKARMGNY